MDTGKFTLEQCSLLYGIPEGTVAEYIKLGSPFFIAKKKHDSMDVMCKELGIGQSRKDPRSKYYTSPYYNLGEKGFVKKENIGPRLTIDGVNLGNQVYTILGNPEKNKIVALIPGVKSSIVTDAIRKEIPFEERLKVREVTLDMSPTMDFIVGELFPQAKRTLDRFHVTKNILEDIQSIRMRIKTIIKSEELEKEEQCKIDRKKYIPKKLENSETKLDFITRLRYQLFERRKDWGEYQTKRWEVLKQHSEFDKIRVAYELLEKFYEIYDSKITREEARLLWSDWFRVISQHESIKELQNAGRTIKNHLEGILNYFGERFTNAFTECDSIPESEGGFRMGDDLKTNIICCIVSGRYLLSGMGGEKI